MTSKVVLMLALSLPTMALARSQSSTCDPAWLPTFGAEPGFNAPALAATAFDDGTGVALYVGGEFTVAGGVSASRIARWDGASWHDVADGLNGTVNALAVFDDGSGAALYAGGSFTLAGGQFASRVARWNGSVWRPVGSGVSNSVNALEVFDDGSGPALFAAGEFTFAGGAAANRIAKWDGQGWSALGAGFDASAYALAVHDDGTGPALFAGGLFNTAGGQPSPRLARWDGAAWNAVGQGLAPTVYSLASFTHGGSNALIVGGTFWSAGGQPIANVAAWDGAGWSALGSGVNAQVRALEVWDDGTGAALYVGGSMNVAGGMASGAIARWDGSAWSTMSGSPAGMVRALAPLSSSGGSELFAVGSFLSAGGTDAPRVARWNGTQWGPLGAGGLNGAVHAIRQFDDGAGAAVYVGGEFTSIGGQPLAYLARFDGTNWSAVGDALDGPVFVLEVIDDGAGPALYAGGSFTKAGSFALNGLGRWDGSSWGAFGSGLLGSLNPITMLPIPAEVYGLAQFDDGSGPSLYAGGYFAAAGGLSAGSIARWNGAAWSAVGSGFPTSVNTVRSLIVADLGQGPVLVASGSFLASGNNLGVLAWDGASWSTVGAGLQAPGLFESLLGVLDLALFDDGSGTALYAGGLISSSGGVSLANLARWTGTSWVSVGGGANLAVRTLEVIDDGFGAALHVAGAFDVVGGIAATGLARWDGTAWSAIPGGAPDQVLALEQVDELGGPALYVGGAFAKSPGSDSFLARWKSCGFGAPMALFGCSPAATQLSSTSAALLLGKIAGFELHSSAGDGVALLLGGAPGIDSSGCGTQVPGLGEVLLSTAFGPFQVAVAPTSNGAAVLNFSVPANPALAGFEVGLQAAHVVLSAPGVPVEWSNGLVGRLLP
ncbi:MAG: hypothetical protein GC161_12710 [Planctomycetaceae bacterium]|nr:hypothetical protein [Planctomycetaceae bacterium]